MQHLLVLMLLASSRAVFGSNRSPLFEVNQYSEESSNESVDPDVLNDIFGEPEDFGKSSENPDLDKKMESFGKPEDFGKSTEHSKQPNMFAAFNNPADFGKTTEHPDQALFFAIFGDSANSEGTTDPSKQPNVFAALDNPADFGKTTEHPDQALFFAIFGDSTNSQGTTEHPNQSLFDEVFGDPLDYGKTTEHPNQSLFDEIFGDPQDYGKTTDPPLGPITTQTPTTQRPVYDTSLWSILFPNLTTAPPTATRPTTSRPTTSRPTTSRPTTTPSTTTSSATTAQTTPHSSTLPPKAEECLLVNNARGVCVSLDQCNIAQLTGGLDEQSLQDIGLYNGCLNTLLVCCPNESMEAPRPDPDHKYVCGKANPQGLPWRGGDSKPVVFGEFPWMLAILSDDETFVGPASLIGPRAAITAAIVVFTRLRDEVTMKVRAGDWNRLSSGEILPHVDSAITDASIHEEFHPASLSNNIAFLLLDTPLQPMDHIGYACLPPPGLIPQVGAQCYSTVWGSVLEKSAMDVVGAARCEASLRTSGVYRRKYKLHKSLMCAGGGQSRETCKKIMGSPLVCPIPNTLNRYTQYGIGFECGARLPALYVNVALFRAWIDEQMEIAKQDTSTYSY